MFGVIKREVRRRSSIEPVIGHMKTDGHLGRRLGRVGEGFRLGVFRSRRPLGNV